MSKISTGTVITGTLSVILLGFVYGVLLPTMVSISNTIMSVGGVLLTILTTVGVGTFLWNKFAISEAKSLKLKNSSLTPQLIQYESVMRWDGNLPKMTGGAIPFINMDNLTNSKSNN